MTESGEQTATRPGGWRNFLIAAVAVAALGAILFSGLFWYMGTPGFAARVRQAVVRTLQRTTGGRVEIGSFHWSVRHLAIEIDGLTIHGKEPPDQLPYLRVDQLRIRAKIISFFSPKVGLASLRAEHPVIHLIVYPDGTTNQPQPRVASKRPLPQTLLSLAIDTTQVRHGLLMINDRAVPWEIAAGPLALDMRYVAPQRRYEASLQVANLTFQLKNAQAAHSQLTAILSLAGDQVRIEDLRLRTGGSMLTVNGRLWNFSQPHWQAALHGSVDAGQIGAIAGVRDLRKGTAQLALTASGVGGDGVQVDGQIGLRAGQWEASWLSLQNVELHTHLHVDRDQCSLTHFSAVLDDQGRIEGSLLLKHCLGPSAPQLRPVSGLNRAGAGGSAATRTSRARALIAHLHAPHFGRRRPQPPAPRTAVYQPLDATFQAQVSDITLPLVLAAVAPRQYQNIGFATATSGVVTGHWTGAGNGLVVQGDLTMRSPRRLRGLIPVAGSARAEYLGDNRHLVIERADLNTPGTEVHASGTLTLLPKDLTTHLRLDTTGRNLAEFDRLLTVLDLKTTPADQPHALPVQLLGSASFHGEVRGSYFALEAVGHLDSGPLQIFIPRHPSSGSLAQPMDGGAAARAVTWDQFHADLDAAPSRVIVRNALLTRANTKIHASLALLPDRTAPDTYTYDRRTRFSASLQASDASLAELQSVFGTQYPVQGSLAANAHLAGDLDDLNGAGELTVTRGVIDGQAMPKMVVQLQAQGHSIRVTQLELATIGGHAAGQLSYDDRTGALDGGLTGSGFALGQIAALQRGKLPLEGTAGFHLQAAGTTASPVVTGGFQIDGLTLNRVPMGRLHADVHLQGGTVYLISRADLLQTHLDADGQVRLSGNYPAQAVVTFADFNVDPVLRLLTPTGISGRSAIQGRITLSGPLKQPRAIQANADLETFTATIDNLPIHSVGPVRASLRDGRLQLEPFELRGKDMEVTTQGTVDLLRDYRMDLHAQGSVDAALASVMNPNLQASGQMRFVVDARGTAQRPSLHGSATIDHLNAHMLSVTNGLTDMNGALLFDQDRVVVQSLKGYSGGGELDLGGFIGYRDGLFLDLTAQAKDVRVRYPQGVSSTADAKLHLVGNTDSMLLSGDVEMMRFGVGSDVDLTALSGGGVSAPIDPTSPLNRVRLDIHLTSSPELGFQNSFASLSGDVNLHIRGTLEDPSVLGRIDISEGSATFAGTKYRLDQGDIVFANPVTISPQIDLEATARVQNYDIIITLHGPPSKLDIAYRSEPPLTQSDVLALLALGRTNEQAAMYGEQQQQGADLTSEALLGGAVNAAVSSRIQKLFGVGSVRVDPNFVGALGESTARVTVEEQVGRDLTLTFATNVNTTAQQLLQAQYDLTQNVSVIAVRDEADVFSLYLQIRGKHK